MEPPPNSVHPKSRAAWRAWLEKHHARGAGVWLIRYKKAAGKLRFDYADAVESTANRSSCMASGPCCGVCPERVARMIELGRKEPAGLKKVRAAQAEDTAVRAACNERANQWRPATPGLVHRR